MADPAYPADFYYDVVDGGDVLLYPNPESAAARSFYAREVFENDAEVRDGAIWVEDRNWEDVREHWLPSESLTIAPRHSAMSALTRARAAWARTAQQLELGA
ncbi:MAG: hypothetical protein H0T97_06130 [Actinobacteria bacterium]|nr:hypothetical protein [Actinomycetota bacterium]